MTVCFGVSVMPFSTHSLVNVAIVIYNYHNVQFKQMGRHVMKHKRKWNSGVRVYNRCPLINAWLVRRRLPVTRTNTHKCVLTHFLTEKKFILNVCCVLVFCVFLCCSVCLFLCGPFCHGALLKTWHVYIVDKILSFLYFCKQCCK